MCGRGFSESSPSCYGLNVALCSGSGTEFRARWHVTVVLFVMVLSLRLPVNFSPLSDPMAAGLDAFF